VCNVKKLTYILAGVGLLGIFALAVYLGGGSEKIIETILGGGVFGIFAALFHKHTGVRNNRGRSGGEPGVSIDELEGIRQRYRDANKRLESGLNGARSEAGQLREGLQRDRERIRGFEKTARGVRDAADKLDELIQRIQEEGIDP